MTALDWAAVSVGTGTRLEWADLSVTSSGSAPVPNAGADRSVEAGAPIQLVGTAVSATGIAAWSWTQTQGDPVTLTGTGPTRTGEAPTKLAGQTLRFALSVTDTGGVTSVAPDTVDVVVAAAPVRVKQADGTMSPRSWRTKL